jgi:hypothetical protein
MQSSDILSCLLLQFRLDFYFLFIIFGDRLFDTKLNLYYAQPTSAAKATAKAVSSADPADETAADTLYGP